MKNKIYLYFVIFFKFYYMLYFVSSDQFNFNVTEIEILENGNLVKDQTEAPSLQMMV